MSFKELILQRLKGKLGGKHSVNSGGFLPQSLPQSLPKNYQKFTKSLPAKSNTIGQKNCESCSYHDTGPDSFGKGIVHWCGPWRDANGDLHWFNIEELAACPKGKRL